MLCQIRKWELSDAEALVTILSDQKTQDNLRDGLAFPYTKQDAIEYISSILSACEDDTFAFAIVYENKVVGSIAVSRQQNIYRLTGELGYSIAKDYWGKGIASKAISQVCQYVFDKSDMIRIYAEPFAHNLASCRVLEKVGFHYEGTLRSNAIKNGKIIDMKMYSLLKTDMKL